jgi:hypothetical protein
MLKAIEDEHKESFKQADAQKWAAPLAHHFAVTCPSSSLTPLGGSRSRTRRSMSVRGLAAAPCRVSLFDQGPDVNPNVSAICLFFVVGAGGRHRQRASRNSPLGLLSDSGRLSILSRSNA